MVDNGKPKTETSDDKKIHGVSHTGVKIIASIVMLLILGASAYATYRFTQVDVKMTEMYVGLAFMWIAVLGFMYIIVGKIIMDKYYFEMLHQLYKAEKGIYFLLMFTLFAFLVSFGLILYSNVELQPPLGLSYTRHCPNGTELGAKVKSPEELS